MQDIERDLIAERTAAIVAAYVSHNAVTAADLPSVIASVHRALSDIVNPAPVPEPVERTPAVPINKSVFPDRIISLETGKSFRSLKRHLGALGMMPEQYREKWGLPANYPMVCSDYSRVRSGLAKQSGLGGPRNSGPQLVASAA